MKASIAARNLSDLLNISFALAENLRRVGIRTPEDLVGTGAEAAWQSLRLGGLQDSVQVLFALEGAIQGVSWRALDPGRRQQLMHFFREASSWPAFCREAAA